MDRERREKRAQRREAVTARLKKEAAGPKKCACWRGAPCPKGLKGKEMLQCPRSRASAGNGAGEGCGCGD